MSPAVSTSDHHTTQSGALLHGASLAAARVIRTLIIALSVVIAAIAVPAGYNAALTACLPNAEFLRQIGVPAETCAGYFLGLDLFTMLPFIAVSAIIFWRRSDDWMAMLLSVALVTYAITSTSILRDLDRANPAWHVLVEIISFFGNASGLVCLYLFPDGHFVPRWTRWAAAVWVVWMGLWPFVPGSFLNFRLWPPAVYLAVISVWFISALYSQVYRYRHAASPAQRQQTKWAVFGFAVLYGWLVALNLPTALAPALGEPGVPRLIYTTVAQTLGALFQFAVPVTLGISLLRYRLWDIDFVINRSLVYGALTLTLVSMFGMTLFIISRLSQNVAGGALLAVAVSAAAFGALFQPMQRRLQRAVDRRLFNIRVAYPIGPAPSRSSLAGVLRRTEVADYQGLELIGRGGMAEVYRSVHPTLGEPVAIKVLPADRAIEPGFQQRFAREAQVLAGLDHNNIARVYDYGEKDSAYYMVMEYFGDTDLAGLMRTRGRLTLAEALPFVRQIASALDYAHAQGLVHRDIKPSNVLLDCNGHPEAVPREGCRAALTDFGIAKFADGRSRLTQTSLVGTADYMAPEQIQASANVDRRADVYALGVMVYEMLTGQLPFKHHNPGAVLIAHLSQPAPDPRDLALDLPREATRAIQRAMAKDPADRFATAGEFAAALEPSAAVNGR